MHGGPVPVAVIDPLFTAVEIELIHPERDRNVFRLPLFFIGVHVLHPDVAHNSAAARIVCVVSRRNVGYAVGFCLRYDRLDRFGDNPPAPKFFAKPVAEIIRLVRVYIDISYGAVVLFQADRIGVSSRQSVLCGIPLIEKLSRLFDVFERKSRQKAVDLFVAQDTVQIRDVVLSESAQYQSFRL